MDPAQDAGFQPDVQLYPYTDLLPTSPSEEDGSSSTSTGYWESLSSTTPRPDSSDNSTVGQWPSRSIPSTDLDHCCSLLNDIWTFSSPSTSTQVDLDDDDKILVGNGVENCSNLNVSLCEFPGKGSQHQPNARVIFSVDVEYIEPNDVPHHPFDREMEFGNEKRGIILRKPHGIAINSKTEQIYVADREYNVVLVLGPDGSFQCQFGGFGQEPGKFFRPTCLAFDAASDRLYITDKDNHRVQVFDTTCNNNKFLFSFGSRGSNVGEFLYPWGIAVLNKGDSSLVAVADSRNQRIQFFTKDGIYVEHFDDFSTSGAPAQEEQKPPSWITSKSTKSRKMQHYPSKKKNQPRGLAFDPTGELLYITDFNTHWVFTLDLAKRTLNKFPAASANDARKIFKRPSGIDVDLQGNVFICDQRNQSLKMFRKDGSEVKGFLAGISFDLPHDLSLYPGLAGYLAVLDLNGRVRVINYSN